MGLFPFPFLTLHPKTPKALAGIALALTLVFACVLPVRADDDRTVITKVKPVYPEMAKRLKIAGTVMLNATVTASGTGRDWAAAKVLMLTTIANARRGSMGEV